MNRSIVRSREGVLEGSLESYVELGEVGWDESRMMADRWLHPSTRQGLMYRHR